MLEVNNLSVRYEGRYALKNVSLSIDEGEWLMLVGPNGAGKSTLVSAISRGVKYEGEVLLGGRDIMTLKPRSMAKTLGVLRQSSSVGYAYTVEQVVSMGRYAHTRGALRLRDEQGAEMIEKALRMTGLIDMRERSMLTLSGGEAQRVFLAQVFAQNPRLLVLDEPTNHLDLPYQKQVFGLIDKWLLGEGRAVISVVHDLSLARAYGTRAMLLSEGETVADGSANEALTPENLERVYGIDVYAWMRELLHQWEA